jgi:pimeloyl-ACP methyl ester carboxylesterase
LAAPVFESKYRVVWSICEVTGGQRRLKRDTLQELASDVEALIENKYAGQKFVLVGHSMGGQVAAILGARRPDLVKAIVSVDGTLGVPAGAQPTYEKLGSDIQAGGPGEVVPAVFSVAAGSGLCAQEALRRIRV